MIEIPEYIREFYRDNSQQDNFDLVNLGSSADGRKPKPSLNKDCANSEKGSIMTKKKALAIIENDWIRRHEYCYCGCCQVCAYNYFKENTEMKPSVNESCAKLKTLKDLPKYEAMYSGYPLDKDMIDPEELRQEAIKWVKEDLLEMVITPNTTWLLNRWKKRLNITEDDLK